MNKELIEEKIKNLQSNNKLWFKQTSEIIEIVYRVAIEDILKEKNISIPNNSNNKLKEKSSKIKELELELDKVNQSNRELKSKIDQKKFSNKTLEEKIIAGKLEVLNKVFDWIYYDKKDLLTIYSELKQMIDQLNDQKKNINIHDML